MGEYLVSKAGLGYLIIYGSQIFNLDLVMAGTILLCILATVMYFVIALIEKLVNKKLSK
jgi:NitT/TauT family transport system permease protein